MAYRLERVEKIIERELASILFNNVKNEKLKFVSITKVSVTKDEKILEICCTKLC